MYETFLAMCERAKKYYPELLIRQERQMIHFESVSLNTLNIMYNILDGIEVVMVSLNDSRRIYTHEPESFHYSKDGLTFVKTTRPLNNLIRQFEPALYKQKDIQFETERYEKRLLKESLKQDRKEAAIENRKKRQDNYNKYNKKQKGD